MGNTFVCALMSEWRSNLRLTDKSQRLSLVREKEIKHQKKHWLADIRHIGGIVHVPFNTPAMGIVDSLSGESMQVT